jgi:hypothetical protein
MPEVATFERFVLTLDLLYIIGAVEMAAIMIPSRKLSSDLASTSSWRIGQKYLEGGIHVMVLVSQL